MVISNQPRDKCCEGCAFRRSDPQGEHVRLRQFADGFRMGRDIFYCIHTEDRLGRNQICAGYMAKFGRHIPCIKNKIAEEVAREARSVCDASNLMAG